MNWMSIAEKEIGVHELRDGENSRILHYHSFTTLNAKKDEIHWCSSFVCFAMESAGFESTKSALARSWLTFGEPCVPKYGAILVFPGIEAWQGHVAFYVYQDKHFFYCLGGNQDNSVSVKPFLKEKLIQARYPGPDDRRTF